MHIGHVSASMGLNASRGVGGRATLAHSGELSDAAATLGTNGRGWREQALGGQEGQHDAAGFQEPGLEHEQGQEEDHVLEQAQSQIQAHAARQGVRLEFSMHQESGQLQVAVLDGDSGKVLRKIPEDEFLALAQRMAEYGGGPLLDRSL